MVVAHGCSLILVKPAPASSTDGASASASLECTDTDEAPTADVLPATLAATFVGVGIASAASGGAFAVATGLITILIGVPVAAIFGGSAIYGFNNTARCRELKLAQGTAHHTKRILQTIPPTLDPPQLRAPLRR
jgi:hypothetical protein